MPRRRGHCLREVLKFSESRRFRNLRQFQLVIKVKAKDMNHLDKIIVDELRGIPDILLTATMLIAKEYK
jgi:DNA-binding Lrp family transcriptional regulator